MLCARVLSHDLAPFCTELWKAVLGKAWRCLASCEDRERLWQFASRAIQELVPGVGVLWSWERCLDKGVESFEPVCLFVQSVWWFLHRVGERGREKDLACPDWTVNELLAFLEFCDENMRGSAFVAAREWCLVVVMGKFGRSHIPVAERALAMFAQGEGDAAVCTKAGVLALVRVVAHFLVQAETCMHATNVVTKALCVLTFTPCMQLLCRQDSDVVQAFLGMVEMFVGMATHPGGLSFVWESIVDAVVDLLLVVTTYKSVPSSVMHAVCNLVLGVLATATLDTAHNVVGALRCVVKLGVSGGMDMPAVFAKELVRVLAMFEASEDVLVMVGPALSRVCVSKTPLEDLCALACSICSKFVKASWTRPDKFFGNMSEAVQFLRAVTQREGVPEVLANFPEQLLQLPGGPAFGAMVTSIVCACCKQHTVHKCLPFVPYVVSACLVEPMASLARVLVATDPTWDGDWAVGTLARVLRKPVLSRVESFVDVNTVRAIIVRHVCAKERFEAVATQLMAEALVALFAQDKYHDDGNDEGARIFLEWLMDVYKYCGVSAGEWVAHCMRQVI